MTREEAKAIREKVVAGEMVADAGGIRRTAPEQSDKLGFDWVRTYVNSILVYTEYVAQDNPAGTAENPIAWAQGMALIQNAYYTYEGARKVWTGEAGAAAAWDDENFVAW